MNPIHFLKILADVPANEIWRFAVDGKFQAAESGPAAFEAREPGSIGGIIDGLTLAIESSHKPLTTQLIRDVHAKCMQPLSSDRAEPGQYRKASVSSNIDLSYFSMAGIGEFLVTKKNRGHILVGFAVKIKNKVVALATLSKEDRKKHSEIMYKPTDILTTNDFYKNFKDLKMEYENHDLAICFIPPLPACIAEDMDAIVKNYNSKISKCDNRDSKILLIAETIQDFLQLHPFRDGNNRTFVNCILNKMLIENFNQMAIFNEPNIFEFHAVSEIKQNIEVAITNADALLNKKISIFDYATENLHNKFIDIGNAFKNKLIDIIRSYYKTNSFTVGYVNVLNFYSAPKKENLTVAQNDSEMLLYVAKK